MFIRIKLLPYLFVICGIICLFSGEASVFASLFMIALGGVWLYFRHSGNSAPAQSATPAQQEKPVQQNSLAQQAAPASESESIFRAELK